jgi:hypothetical protein
MKLQAWKVMNHELIGRVYGSGRYEDDTLIHTSPLITSVYDDGLFLFRTENSVYECTAADFAGTDVELNILIENSRDQERQATAKIEGLHRELSERNRDKKE